MILEFNIVYLSNFYIGIISQNTLEIFHLNGSIMVDGIWFCSLNENNYVLSPRLYLILSTKCFESQPNFSARRQNVAFMVKMIVITNN